MKIDNLINTLRKLYIIVYLENRRVKNQNKRVNLYG